MYSPDGLCPLSDDNLAFGPKPLELGLIVATTAFRIAAALLAYRLYRRYRETRFAAVTFVLGVTAVFPYVEFMEPPETFMREWLPSAASGLAMLLTALVLVRTLTELSLALDEVTKSRDRLEQRVQERTSALQDSNVALEGQIQERKRVEEALLASQSDLRSSQRDLRVLAARLIAAQEEERKRLARELHDDTSQTLAALALEIANLQRSGRLDAETLPERLSGIELKVHRLADDIHDMSRLLHPSILDDLGIEAAIRTECERFSQREGIEVRFEARRIPSEIPDDCKLTFYRIAQEGLRNIAKHAGATQALVQLAGVDGELRLLVEDSGKGFDVDEARERIGLGLVSMSERVRLLDGVLKVESELGQGAQIEVRVPLARSRDEQTASVAG